MDDLVKEFLAETAESLAAIDSQLVAFERHPDDAETLRNIFRLLHTIKGTCGFLGLARLGRVAHAGENVLGRLRDGTLAVTPGIVTLILGGIDSIRDLLAALEATGVEPAGDDASLIAALDAVAEGHPPPATGSAPEPAPGPEPTPVATEPPSEPAAARASVRVGVDALDGLMTLAGEMVLARDRLLAAVGDDDALAAPLKDLRHLTGELREGVMRARMQPVEVAWAKLPRLVRDLALESGKKVELRMNGGETELDRQVLELIRDPLTHMVRNAVDHGLEAPAQRAAAGKPETGTIALDAFHQGGHVVIRIRDDGRGLDVARIKAKSVAAGLADAIEVEAMSDREAFRLVFHPGLSTADRVTGLSGRGVGMDVVLANVERIGGAVQIASAARQGSTFTMVIPLTLAIIPALVVECRGVRFAIPERAIREVVRWSGPSGQPVETGDGVPRFRLRGRLLPLASLAALLRLDEATSAAKPYIVVLDGGDGDFGVVVDRVFDIHEIVVKPAPPILGHIQFYSGATILGDGSVIMILDASGIAATLPDAATAEAERDTTPVAVAPEAEGAFVLLFRAGGALRALPLRQVVRLEEIEAATIEEAGDDRAARHRGRLLPLVAVDGDTAWRRGGLLKVVLIGDGERVAGLVVDAIVDIVEARLATDPDLGHAAAIVDVTRFLGRTQPADLMSPHGINEPFGVLLADESPFVRNLLRPVLSAAGYRVTGCDSAQRAVELLESGARVDVIVGDLDMPNLADRVRADRRWDDVPMVALAGAAGRVEAARGHAAGFRHCVAKHARETLVGAIGRALSEA